MKLLLLSLSVYLKYSDRVWIWVNYFPKDFSYFLASRHLERLEWLEHYYQNLFSAKSQNVTTWEKWPFFAFILALADSRPKCRAFLESSSSCPLACPPETDVETARPFGKSYSHLPVKSTVRDFPHGRRQTSHFPTL